MKKPFRFKKFSADDTGCAMKVGTDAVLLGAWAGVAGASKILDVGTGCGLLALMMAQRTGLKTSITAIDIDPVAAARAKENFRSSPWSPRLSSHCIALDDYVNQTQKHFDLMVSNPPWFKDALRSQSEERNLARHACSMTLPALFQAGERLLCHGGNLCIIIPFQDFRKACDFGLLKGFSLSRALVVKPSPSKEPFRALMEFQSGKTSAVSEDTIFIRDAPGSYSKAYRELTKDFYLDF